MSTCVGFDIGNHAIHAAVNKNGRIVRSVCERLPEGLVQNGRITSIESMVDVLKQLRRNQKLRVHKAAVVLPMGQCYCRRFKVAAMTRKQLVFNLPYEFRDFIEGDKRNYFFDYAIVDTTKDENGSVTELDVIASVVKKELVADYIRMFSKAGFKLRTIVPQEIAYVNLMRHSKKTGHCHGILDIGHNAVRLMLFSGDKYEGVRTLDYGCNALGPIVTDHFGVEGDFVVSNYIESNFEGANELEGCRRVYSAMALEVRKAVNFYRFSGGETLEHLHCFGGGARNAALMETLKNELPLGISGLREIFPGANKDGVDYAMIAAAAGATF